MALNQDPNMGVRGESDHIIGVGSRDIVNTVSLTNSDGETVIVPSTSWTKKNKKHNPVKELPVENSNTVQASAPKEPVMESFNNVDVVNLIIPVRIGKNFKAIPNLKEEIWVTEKVEQGTSVVIPKGDMVIRAVNRQDWNSGVQRLVDMLIVDDGPLNPMLHGVLDDMIGTENASEEGSG